MFTFMRLAHNNNNNKKLWFSESFSVLYFIFFFKFRKLFGLSHVFKINWFRIAFRASFNFLFIFFFYLVQKYIYIFFIVNNQRTNKVTIRTKRYNFFFDFPWCVSSSMTMKNDYASSRWISMNLEIKCRSWIRHTDRRIP